MRLAMDLLARHAGSGVHDATHAATALRWRCERIISADRGFDLLAAEGVVRAAAMDFAAQLPDP